MRKNFTQNKNSDINNRRNRRNNHNSNWDPYTLSELSEDLC